MSGMTLPWQSSAHVRARHSHVYLWKQSTTYERNTLLIRFIVFYVRIESSICVQNSPRSKQTHTEHGKPKSERVVFSCILIGQLDRPSWSWGFKLIWYPRCQNQPTLGFVSSSSQMGHWSEFHGVRSWASDICMGSIATPIFVISFTKILSLSSFPDEAAAVRDEYQEGTGNQWRRTTSAAILCCMDDRSYNAGGNVTVFADMDRFIICVLALQCFFLS